MRILLLITTLPLAALISACCCCGSDTSEAEVRTWTVLAHKEPSRDPGYPDMNLVIRDADGDEREFWKPIYGYDHQWGVETKIKVSSGPYYSWWPEPGATKTELVDVVSKKRRKGGRFKMHSVGTPWMKPGKDEFVDGQKFVCKRTAVCRELRTRLSSPTDRVDLTFRHPSRLGDPILLESVGDPTCKDNFDCRPTLTCCGESCRPYEECP